MAQPNVVREPSMEEILASIRRIIESNDPGAGQSISASLPPVYAEEDDEGDAGEIHLTVDNDNAFADESPAESTYTAPELPRAEPAQRPVADNVRSIEERRSISLADVAARVRAASDRQSAQRRAEAEPVRAEPPMSPPQAAAPRPLELRPAHDGFVPMSGPSVSPISATTHVEEEPLAALSRVIQPMSQPARIVEPAPVPLRDIFQSEPELPASQLEQPVLDEANALISSDAGERVARSFDDLAAAFDASSRRSLDEIAEELLRPMLKDWLDDNLPTLVERLVREEIERVARGPRR